MDEKQLIEYLQPVIGLFGDYPSLKALVVLFISITLANLIALIITRLLRRLTSRTRNRNRNRNRLDDRIVELLHRPLVWTVILAGLLLALSLLAPGERLDTLVRSSVATLLIIMWSLFLIRLLRALLHSLSRRAKPQALIRNQTLPLFDNLALIIILTLSIYLIFSAWNIDMTAWLASAGIAGIAVGFAAKDTLANLFSGVFILADSPYKIGDYVVLDSGERGKVTHIGIRSTRILTRDDVEVTIPNAIMGNSRIVNESGGPHEKYRVRVQVSVAYGSDIDRVKAVLMEVAQGCDQICTDPEPRVRFRLFGPSGLDFELLCWIDHPELRGRILDQLNSSVYKRFMADSIEIPYTKQDLYIKEFPHPAADDLCHTPVRR
ncbi:MAG: mechanosensitive ion channel family protein [gamma proteobacterium symbiont of Phacoides pectinatus]